MLQERQVAAEFRYAQTASNEARMPAKAAVDFDIADASDSGRRRRRALVERIGSELWSNHGVLVEDDEVGACLERTRPDGVSVGQILGLAEDYGLVIQSLGRGRATVHNLDGFPVVPAVGAVVTITYGSGAMQCAFENEQNRSGHGR